MSKGAGAASAGGGGGGGGTAAVGEQAQSVISDLGGVANADFLGAGQNPDVPQWGFRPASLAYWRAQYAGRAQAEATRIASNLKTPVRIDIEKYNGKNFMTLIDGRHRMTAAKEAGAKRIRATVKMYDENGSAKTWTGVVKLQ